MGFEVAYDPNQNLQIVKCIKKYPVIYDTRKYPPIEYRGVIDKAWEVVAQELGVSEGYCKGRWTNIKGCFKRYLRNKKLKKSCKDYYLAPYLEFMLPFMRIDKKGHTQSNNDHASQESVSDDEEQLTIDENPPATERDFQVNVVDSDGDEESYIISTNTLQNTQYVEEVSIEDNPDWNFLASLLPDVHRMNPAQKSKFRNAILSSIDTVLYGEEFL